MNGAVSTSVILSELQTLVRRFSDAVDVEVTPDIQAWCKERGVPEENPFRCGRALRVRETGRYLVLLADPITSEMRSSVLAGMEFHGNIGPEDLQLLRGTDAFVRHLVLHELAHVLDPNRTEEECDAWAFEQIRLGA